MKRWLWVAVLGLSFAHPFYMSITDLKYNASEKAFQGTVKVFVGDLETSLRKLTGKPVDLINIKDSARVKTQLADYLSKRLKFTVNGQVKSIQLIGFEHESENIWLYIEIKNCPQPRKLEVQNSILYDYLKEQINIIHLDVGGKKKSSKLVNPVKSASFDF